MSERTPWQCVECGCMEPLNEKQQCAGCAPVVAKKAAARIEFVDEKAHFEKLADLWLVTPETRVSITHVRGCPGGTSRAGAPGAVSGSPGPGGVSHARKPDPFLGMPKAPRMKGLPESDPNYPPPTGLYRELLDATFEELMARRTRKP